MEDFSKTMLFNSLKFKASNSFSSTMGKPIGSIFDFEGKLAIKTIISSVKKNTKKEY